jgi:hypothetical protein
VKTVKKGWDGGLVMGRGKKLSRGFTTTGINFKEFYLLGYNAM